MRGAAARLIVVVLLLAAVGPAAATRASAQTSGLSGPTISSSPAPLPVPGSSPASWSIVTSPNASTGETTNLLLGEACVSASDCWAVGTSSTGTLLRTLTERWDGTSWALVTSPNTSTTHNNLLYGVACVSSTDCWAVGVGYSDALGATQTLIERWNGTSWAIVTSPNATTTTAGATTNLFLGVTCVSASDCWAVGGYDPGPFRQNLIERWDGTSWAIVTSPNTSATQSNSVSSVTCVAAADCWAAGYATTGTSSSQTLIEHWDATSWTIATSANIPGAQNSVLQAVTCVSASDCWAVGYSSATGLDDLTFIEQWNGTSWATVPSPNLPAYSNRLSGVTCVSATDCWAVGREDTGNPLLPNAFQTLVERWNGTVWATVTSPNTSTSQVNFLEAVTCVSGSDCWAVGYFADSDDQTLIERWNGSSWTIVTSADASSVPTNILAAVTCVSASDCWAVGYSAGGSGHTLVERWDGTSWAIVASPNTSSGESNVLSGVTCVSASACWAVGSHGSNSSTNQTLIERWDGTSWRIVTSPNPAATSGNVLTSVTCVSAAACWAVGYSNSTAGGVILSLIERWDGTSWATVTSPNATGAQQNTLTGVTCVSASDCWAVGYDIALNDQTLIERWNGSSWTVVTSPDTSSTQNNFLSSVTCVSTSECWAMGEFQGSNSQTLIERWDGNSWARVTSPNPGGTSSNTLHGVTCASASDCWAVGNSFAASALQTLIEQWDGTSWAIVSSPNTSATQHNLLQSVTCASASDCWAVGYFIGGSGVETLTVEYAAGAGPVVPEVPWLPLLPVVGVAALATRLLAGRWRRTRSSPGVLR